MSDAPQFAVVGHPNKGKSSIVATLAHHDGIAISAASGTTLVSEAYPFNINGKILYTLYDTPGFQRPRQALEWLQNYAKDASMRTAAVQAFVDQHQSCAQENGRFKDEVELLRPIVKNKDTGIIYVVDGSQPYNPSYEAEMSILQWTGQPRMALINPIGGETYVEQWQQALGQYFSIVRVFNPMSADLDKQISILSSFAELKEEWQSVLKDTIAVIRQQNTHCRQQTAYVIAETLADILSHQQSRPVPPSAPESVTQQLREQITASYQKSLRKREQSLRERIKTLYAFQRLDIQENTLNAEHHDLFDQSHWYLFGLSRKSLVILSTSAGSAAGAVIDASVGGASLMLGALAGGLLSASASLFASAKPENIQIKGVPLGGKKINAGPVKNLQFAFVILGRALSYQHAVAARVHADKSIMVVTENDQKHWLENLSKTRQLQLTRLLQKSAKGLNETKRGQLQTLIEALLR